MSTSTSNTFTVGSVTARYAREYWNEAYQNERSIEVALGRWFLARYPGAPALTMDPGKLVVQNRVIEVGCVMPYYGADQHEIVDISDEHPRNRKANALSLDFTGRNLLSISTVEHMSAKEYSNQSDEDSITFLRKVTSEAARYLVTWGIGYNPVLDAWVKAQPASAVPRTFMKRTNWKNEYQQVAESDALWATQFGHSDRSPIPGGFNNANVVVLVTNVPELLAAAPEGAR
jgi:hypothetical protein